MFCYYNADGRYYVFCLDDRVYCWVAMWLDDYWSDCWSGISWWPLAAIG